MYKVWGANSAGPAVPKPRRLRRFSAVTVYSRIPEQGTEVYLAAPGPQQDLATETATGPPPNREILSNYAIRLENHPFQYVTRANHFQLVDATLLIAGIIHSLFCIQDPLNTRVVSINKVC